MLFLSCGMRHVSSAGKSLSSKLLTILIFSVLLLTGCSQRITNLNATGEVIVCFGNSITYGVGAEHEESYPALLSNMINRSVVNSGVAGDTTRDAYLRLEEDVLVHEPYCVIIELGANDFLQKFPHEQTIKNLEAIIQKIQSVGSMVVLCDVSSGFIMSAYRKEFKSLSRRMGCIFVPELMEDILNRPTRRSDRIHPNKEGYQIMAQRIYDKIQPYLNH